MNAQEGAPHAAAPVIATDMDGTLTTAETWRGVLEWINDRRPTWASRRFVALRLPVVFLARSGVVDKQRFRNWWLGDQAKLLRGCSGDELAEMGEWVVEHRLWPARRTEGIARVAAEVAAHPGARLILASGAYQPVADAFARRIGAALALGTPLEVRGDRATGVLAPAATGEAKAESVRRAAAGRPIVAAFGDTAADLPLLRLAARPVAIAPDAALRRVAAAHGWEIVEAKA
jgi:phosphoserine phosphatase